MTTPSGQIAISDINVELGLPTGYSSSLGFLNNYLKSGYRHATPTMDNFRNKAYYQNNNIGNCNNGNCGFAYSSGNIQCQNCRQLNINCANCDTQSWLQPNCNCACTYNCNVTADQSYNCNCNCSNCSKIVCAKFHDLGMMSTEIWAADQAYGRVLRKKDKTIYRGYIKWAKICTQWMDGKGPDFMPWIRNPVERKLVQQQFATDILYRVGQPWSEHMAYIMGTLNKDNDYGRVLMAIGRPLCKFFGAIPRMPRQYRKHGFFTSWTILSLLYFSCYAGKGILGLINLITTTKAKLFKEA